MTSKPPSSPRWVSFTPTKWVSITPALTIRINHISLDLKIGGLFSVALNVEKLTKIGFQNKQSFKWHEDTSSYDIENLEPYQWALHGNKCVNESQVTASQILGLTALKTIDAAMSFAATDGITLKFVESLSLAAVYLAEAKDEDEYESRQDLRHALSRNLEAESRKLKSEWAKSRYLENNNARIFVRNEWGTHKDEYGGNKSESARTYVALVANKFKTRTGDPLKITEKTIREVWLADITIASGCIPQRATALRCRPRRHSWLLDMLYVESRQGQVNFLSLSS